MSDIDFDELDRAVASVLNGSDEPSVNAARSAKDTSSRSEAQADDTANVQAPTPSSDATSDSDADDAFPITVNRPAAPVAIAQPTSRQAAKHSHEIHVSPSVSRPADAPEPKKDGADAATDKPEDKPSKPAAVSAQSLHPSTPRPAQRGRFLDMVHPGSAMAGSRAAQAPSSAPSHQGVSIAPTAAVNQTFVSDVVSTQPKSPSKPVEAEAPVETPAKQDEPDVASEPTTAPEAAAETSIETPPASADFFAEATVADAEKLTEAVVSPFIVDAKVEKRPLGAFRGGENSKLPVGEDLSDQLVQIESEDNLFSDIDSSADGAGALGSFDGVKPSDAPSPRTEKAPKHGKKTLINVTIAVVVLAVGFGVGASLYFFVLQ